MALLDFLKNKKEAEKSSNRRKTTKKAGKKPEVLVEKDPKKEDTQKKEVAQKSKKTGSFSYESVRKPHISEKATFLAEKNQYTFQVSPNFNKTEIKKAIEGIYGVNVLSIKTITIPPKKRRLGKTQGFRKQYVKAIAKIKEGQKIEIL